MQKQIVKVILNAAAVIFFGAINFSALALPVGGQVNGGDGTLTTTGSTLLIEQHSQQLSLEFDQFNIGTSERVEFLQPNRDAVALNRIIGGNGSELLGRLDSNGQVFLINQNGILFGKNSQINVGGLMATTLNISDEDFFSGRWSFSRMEGVDASNALIQNMGNIAALDNGYIALVAPNVINEGSLNSPNGTVALHTADSVVMRFAGQQLLAIETDQASLNAAIKNSGSIYADGGQVLLTAAATNGLLKTVIDNSGVISAQRINQSGGRIFLSAGSGAEQGDIVNTGMIIGSQQTHGDGGSVDISGGRIAQLGTIEVNGQGVGNGGDVRINAQDAIVIANDSLTLANGAEIGDGGTIRYFAFGQTAFYSNSFMEAKGGSNSGDGGFIEVSGIKQVLIDGLVDTSAANGDAGLFYIDPTDIDIVAGGGNVNGAFVTGGGFSDWLPDTVGSSDIGTDLITTLLANNNVTIDTAAADTGADTGTLTVSAAIDLNGGNGKTLTLRSNDLMTISSNICDMGGGASCLATPDDAVSLVFDTQTNAANGSISIGGILINSGGGDISFISDSDLTIGSGATLDSDGGNIVLSANGAGGDFSTLGNIAIESGAGNINIDAVGNVFFDAGDTVDSGGDIAIAGNAIRISAITSTSTSATAVQIHSATSILSRAGIDITATAGGVLLTSTSGIGAIRTNVASLSATNTISGDIIINELNDLSITQLSNVGNITVNTFGNLTLDSDLNLNDMNGSTLILNAAGNLTLNGNVCEGGGTCAAVDDGVILDFDAGGDFNTLGNIDIHSGAGNINIDAVGSVLFNTDDSLVSNGDIAIAGNAVRVAGIESTSASAVAVQINSATTIGGQNGVDIKATSGGVVLTSTSGIFGTTVPSSSFDINTNQLTVSNSVSGNVVLDTRTNLEIVDVNVVGDFSLISTQSNNDLLVSSITHVGGNLLLTPGGLLAIPDTGLNSNGLLTLDASSIVDSGGNIILSGTIADITLGNTAGGINIDSRFDSLSLTSTGSDAIIINDADNLGLTQLSGMGNITVNTVGDLSVDSALDLNGMNGSIVALNAGGDLTLNANVCEGGALCSSLDDVVILDLDAGGDITTIGNVTLHSGGGDISLDALANVSLSQDSIVNSGNGKINVAGNGVVIAGLESTSSGDAITVTSTTDISDRLGVGASAINGVIILNATSGIVGGGGTEDLDVVAQEIRVSNSTSGEVRLNSGATDTVLAQVDVAGLISVNTTGGNITLQENALLAANDISFNSDSGSIVLPSRITLPGRLTLLGAQINNANQTLNVSAQEILLKTTSNQDLLLNVNNTIVDVSMMGDGNLQVNGSNGLTLQDLDADNSAVMVSNGNVSLNTLAGDLNIEADVSASDTSENGVRSGMIEMSVTDGDLIVGALNPVTITSTNNVDQNVAGGLTNASDSQVSIYAHLNGQDDVRRSIVLGDGIGTDVTLLAIGGDITLDALNGANLVAANNRNIFINTDVILTSYNQIGDEQTGTVSNVGSINVGVAQAHVDRQISLVANGVSLSTEVIEELKETVANEVQNDMPADVENDAAPEQVGTDMDVAFSTVFNQCSDSSDENNEDCGAQLAIKKFLGSLLIGGKLPSL